MVDELSENVHESRGLQQSGIENAGAGLNGCLQQYVVACEQAHCGISSGRTYHPACGNTDIVRMQRDVVRGHNATFDDDVAS